MCGAEGEVLGVKDGDGWFVGMDYVRNLEAMCRGEAG
jgi:hypothetical protein